MVQAFYMEQFYVLTQLFSRSALASYVFMPLVKYLRHSIKEKECNIHYLNKSFNHEGSTIVFNAWEPQQYHATNYLNHFQWPA